MIRGTCDFKQLVEFQEQIQKAEAATKLFFKRVSQELAARLLRHAISRTPVDTGTLRRGWTAQTEGEAASGAEVAIQSYVSALPIKWNGNVYEITIINPVHYASFVEYGHRTRNHKGWVEGRFMLTKAEALVESEAANVIERHLQKIIGEQLK